ncbi:MAG: hypothetical protein K6T31_04515 [Alicyclobacillus sp.]|nr:hypothetical protein [Alicyclobacillus sp.]
MSVWAGLLSTAWAQTDSAPAVEPVQAVAQRSVPAGLEWAQPGQDAEMRLPSSVQAPYSVPVQTAQAPVQRPTVPVPGPQTVTADVQFRVVSSVDFRALPGARVLLIGPDGRPLQTGLTNQEGIWRTRVTVQRDPKYPDLGFATALCVANGYNETVIYNVPVRQGTAQPVMLNPIQPGLRNEPMAMLGQIHRLDVIDLVTRYGAAMGLQRQAPIPGEQGYAPWGPQLSAR